MSQDRADFKHFSDVDGHEKFAGRRTNIYLESCQLAVSFRLVHNSEEMKSNAWTQVLHTYLLN